MELLLELSTVVGAGTLVSLLFDELRKQFAVDSALGRYLYAPQFARWLVLILSGAVATAAAYLAEAAGGPKADPAVTAAWSAVASQAVHALRHLSPAPVTGEGQ
jgi:hypothetical protein